MAIEVGPPSSALAGTSKYSPFEAIQLTLQVKMGYSCIPDNCLWSWSSQRREGHVNTQSRAYKRQISSVTSRKARVLFAALAWAGAPNEVLRESPYMANVYF